MSLAVAGAAAAVALAAGWLHRPREPELDAERWFKTALATRLLERVEADGGTADDWAAAVQRWVPWHPAARLLGRKLMKPATFLPVDGLWLEGEAELVADLGTAPTPDARWRRLFETDELVRAALLADPVQLGPGYDLQGTVGISWAQIAAGEGLTEAITSRSPQLWVVVEGMSAPRAPICAALVEQLGDGALHIVLTEEAPEAQAVALRDAVAERRTDGQQVVLVGVAEGAHLVVRAMVGSPGFRDHVAAVVSIAGRFSSGPREEAVPGDPWSSLTLRDWWLAHWRHAHLDTEQRGRTPVMSLALVDLATVQRAETVDEQHPEDPPDVDALHCGVLPLSLGALPDVRDLPVEEVATSLRIVVLGWLRAAG